MWKEEGVHGRGWEDVLWLPWRYNGWEGGAVEIERGG